MNCEAHLQCGDFILSLNLNGLPLFHVGSNVQLVGEACAWLGVQVPVRIGNLGGRKARQLVRDTWLQREAINALGQGYIPHWG